VTFLRVTAGCGPIGTMPAPQGTPQGRASKRTIYSSWREANINSIILVPFLLSLFLAVAMLFPQFCLLASAASAVLAQFVPPPTDLKNATGYMGIPVRYKEVPTGICEQDPTVKSYTGYVDVSENQHIFFWFFETRNMDPENAPLTVWINGGPGSSSMGGLFQENGPCGVEIDGNVYSNPYSWSNVSNIIYIDQPTQVCCFLSRVPREF
jgi:hypothetical protein